MIDYPWVKCPECHVPQQDMDGFGVVACDVCGYCTHPSMSGWPPVCGICKAIIPETES